MKVLKLLMGIGKPMDAFGLTEEECSGHHSVVAEVLVTRRPKQKGLHGMNTTHSCDVYVMLTGCP